MKIQQIIEKVLSESKSVKDIAKELASSDWDMKDRVWVSGDTLEIADSFHLDGKRHLQNLIDSWTKPSGSHAKYFHDEYGITFKLVKSDIQTNAEGKYAKFAGKNMGAVVIFLKIH